jgi:hypothetical protein
VRIRSARHCERENPGEVIHIDIKKLERFERVGHRITDDLTGQSNSRGVGCEFVHAYKRLSADPVDQGQALEAPQLERDDFCSNLIPPYLFDLSMIFSENRHPLFRIML